MDKKLLVIAIFWPIFVILFSDFATITKPFQKLKRARHRHTRRHLRAKFDVLRPSQS